MENRVVVTGFGCVSPVGNDVNSMWESICNGKSGVARITHFDPTEYKCHIAAEVKDFDSFAIFGSRESRRLDRYAQFALTATEEALAHSKIQISDSNRDRIGVVVGTGIGGLGTLTEQIEVMRSRGPLRVSPFLVPMMLPDTAPGLIAIQYGIRGPNMAVVTACATGTNAIGEASEMIRRGVADIIIAGGAEAAILPIAMAGLGTMQALSTRNDDPQRASRPFDQDRDGFVMGEGAAIVVLESLESATQRNVSILGEVTGYGTTNDAYHISAPSEGGSGAARCMQMALDHGGFEATDIDYINAHGTSTKLNDLSETLAIKTVFGEDAYSIPISSTKSMTGHLLGASGTIEAIICLKTLEDDYIPATINYETPDPDCDLDYVPNTPRHAIVNHIMSNSFGFGGHNATVIISRYIGGE